MNYDVGIIGGGPGGYTAALRVAALGGKAVLIERDRVGGVCLHRGCIPTKYLLNLFSLTGEASRSGNRGVEMEIKGLDLDRIAEGKEEVIERLARSMERLLDESGVECIHGLGSVDADMTVRVDGRARVSAGKIILATGSRPASLQEGIVKGRSCWTSHEALRLESIPETLLVVGGGAIGCELATIFNGLGSRVTIVEAMGEILPFMDNEVGAELRKHLRRAGISIHVASKLVSVDVGGEAIVSTPKEDRSLHAEAILVAVGRIPEVPAFPEGMLGMEEGSITVGSDMRTSNPSVFAVGDVTGKGILAHLAMEQARVAAANAMGGEARMDYSAVPNCVVTHPEVASVGIGEGEARARGHSIGVGRVDYREIGLAHATGELAGFAKIVCDKKNGTVLGAQIIGARATDLITEISIAVKLKLSASELAGVIHAHPTYGEVIARALKKIT